MEIKLATNRRKQILRGNIISPYKRKKAKEDHPGDAGEMYGAGRIIIPKSLNDEKYNLEIKFLVKISIKLPRPCSHAV